MKAPTLILPTRVERPPLRVNSREIGAYVPSEALFPDLEASEASMAALLGTLGRDAVLLARARLNTVVSGTGHPDLGVPFPRFSAFRVASGPPGPEG